MTKKNKKQQHQSLTLYRGPFLYLLLFSAPNVNENVQKIVKTDQTGVTAYTKKRFDQECHDKINAPYIYHYSMLKSYHIRTGGILLLRSYQLWHEPSCVVFLFCF